jgi:hypothetical protein
VTSGWLVQVKVADSRGEHAHDWVVGSSDWMTACNVARQAQAIEAASVTDFRIISTRALRPVTPAEASGLGDGEVKRWAHSPTS